jgi:hypothetical protein
MERLSIFQDRSIGQSATGPPTFLAPQPFLQLTFKTSSSIVHQRLSIWEVLLAINCHLLLIEGQFLNLGTFSSFATRSGLATFTYRVLNQATKKTVDHQLHS